MFTRTTTSKPSHVWVSLALAFMLVTSFFSTTMRVASANSTSTSAEIAAAVPETSVIYTGMDLNTDSDQWVQTRALLQRAGINDLLESQSGMDTDDIGDAAEASNFTGSAALVFTNADALMNFSSGTVTGASMDTSSLATTGDVPPVPEGFALVIKPDDADALGQQFVDLVNSEASNEGVSAQTVDYNGVTITYWEQQGDENTNATATAVIDGYVVLATRPTDIEPIVDTVQGTTPSLAESESFKKATEKLPAETLMLGYMDMDALLAAAMQSPDASSALNDIPSMNMNGGIYGWAVYASDAGFHMDSVLLPTDASMMDHYTPFTPSMASKIPADVMLFSNGSNFANNSLVDSLGPVLQSVMSEMNGTMDPDATAAAVSPTPTVDEVWAMFEQLLGFNPNTDLLSKLDGEFVMAAGVYGIETGMPTPGFLFVSETSDPDTLSSTSDTITNLLNQASDPDSYTVSSRTIGTDSVTVITINDDQTSGIPVVIEFGIVNGAMVIGTPNMIDEFASGTAPKLADNASFQKAFEQLPSENIVGISYMNIEGQLLPILDFAVGMMGSATTTLDNHADCADYGTQQEAQEAYDADPSDKWVLDQNFNNVACEDHFADTTSMATPAMKPSDEIHIESAANVTWIDGDTVRSNSILVIGD